MRNQFLTILRGIPASDIVVPDNANFRLTVQTTYPLPANKIDWLFLDLNNSDYLGGQTNVIVNGSQVLIEGRSGRIKASFLYDHLLSMLDNYVPYTNADLILDRANVPAPTPPPAPPRTVSTREPITPREEDRPVVVVEPDEPTDTGSNGNGNTGSGNDGNTGQTPTPLPFPVDSDGTIFGIKPLYLLLGVGAFFFLKGK